MSSVIDLRSDTITQPTDAPSAILGAERLAAIVDDIQIVLLGETLDLHGGGLDLVFPHHENEIAQSEAATGQPFSRCWVHNGFVEVDKEKMSKSLGNFFTARDLFERVEPEAEPEVQAAPGAAQSRAQPSPAAEPAPPEPPPAPAAEPAAGPLGSWVVQVGSFSNESNALALRDKLRQGGFTTQVEKVRVSGKTHYRVRVGPFLERDEAEQKRNQLADKFKLSGRVLSYP